MEVSYTNRGRHLLQHKERNMVQEIKSYAWKIDHIHILLGVQVSPVKCFEYISQIGGPENSAEIDE
jgi:hypothetical protein